MLTGSNRLFGHFFHDGQLSAIITAGGANRVVDVPSTAVRTDGQRRSDSLVVGSAFECSGL